MIECVDLVLRIFTRHETWVDLFVLDMIDFDIILGMDSLASNYAIVKFFAKIVTLDSSDVPMIALKGTYYLGPKRVISYVQV